MINTVSGQLVNTVVTKEPEIFLLRPVETEKQRRENTDGHYFSRLCDGRVSKQVYYVTLEGVDISA